MTRRGRRLISGRYVNNKEFLNDWAYKQYSIATNNGRLWSSRPSTFCFPREATDDLLKVPKVAGCKTALVALQTTAFAIQGRIKMSKKNQLATLVALGVLSAPMLAQAQGAYDYESFNYPGATVDVVFGINNRGDVAGFGIVSGDVMPYVYDSKKGGFTNVTPVAGFDSTAVFGIADNGTLVGSVFGAGIESGLIIDKNGATTVFEHPDAIFLTQARDINEKGLVTGFRDDPNDRFFPFSPENGFIYDSKNGTFTDIVPSLFTIANGINARGDVVGHAIFDGFFGAPDPCGSSGFVRLGWLRTDDGSVTYFSVNGGQTAARGITDSGTIAGWVGDGVSGPKGFVVKLDGSQCQSITIADADLLHVPGASLTFVGDIKNSGEVVGHYVDGTTGVQLGYIARPQ